MNRTSHATISDLVYYMYMSACTQIHTYTYIRVGYIDVEIRRQTSRFLSVMHHRGEAATL